MIATTKQPTAAELRPFAEWVVMQLTRGAKPEAIIRLENGPTLPTLAQKASSRPPRRRPQALLADESELAGDIARYKQAIINGESGSLEGELIANARALAAAADARQSGASVTSSARQHAMTPGAPTPLVADAMQLSAQAFGEDTEDDDDPLTQDAKRMAEEYTL